VGLGSTCAAAAVQAYEHASRNRLFVYVEDRCLRALYVESAAAQPSLLLTTQ
jgi:hypothetical protein